MEPCSGRVCGQQVAVQTLDLAAGYTPLVLSAAGPDTPGPHDFQVQADPAVPGLLFTLTQTSWVPWRQGSMDAGFTLRVEPPARATVGQRVPVTLRAAVPGGEPFQIVLVLPVGLQVDEPSLQALVDEGALRRYELDEGRLVLHAPAVAAGASFTLSFDAIPTLAGEFQWGGASLALASTPDQAVRAAPGRWTVGL